MPADKIVAACLSLLILASGCSAGWRRMQPPGPRIYDKRQQVQVWRGTETVVLHAVVVDSASLSGVPFIEHPDCDSCRMSLPIASVDSVRLGNRERGFLVGVWIVALSIGALLAYWCLDGCTAD